MPDQIVAAIQEMAAGMGSNERILGFMEGVKYTMETMKQPAQTQKEGVKVHDN